MNNDEIKQILKSAKSPFPSYGKVVDDFEINVAEKVIGEFDASECADALVDLLNSWNQNRPPAVTDIRQRIFELRKSKAVDRDHDRAAKILADDPDERGEYYRETKTMADGKEKSFQYYRVKPSKIKTLAASQGMALDYGPLLPNGMRSYRLVKA